MWDVQAEFVQDTRPERSPWQLRQVVVRGSEVLPVEPPEPLVPPVEPVLPEVEQVPPVICKVTWS